MTGRRQSSATVVAIAVAAMLVAAGSLGALASRGALGSGATPRSVAVVPVPTLAAEPGGQEAVVPPLPVPTTTAAPAPAPPVAAGPGLVAPIRGVWVHVLDATLLSAGSIEVMLDRVVAAGGNTVVVEVARRHDAYYASAILRRGPDPAFEPGLDVLAAVSAGARRRGLAVHAWYTAMPMWQPPAASSPDSAVPAATPTPPNWVYTQHGPEAPEADRWVSRSVTGEWGAYLDPAVPAAQDLVVAIAAELAAYDIDAVHLDYLRYAGAEWGYNPVALQRFAAETGRTDVPAPDDLQWSDWRRAQTTTILQRIREAVHAVNPAVGVSAALIAWGDGPAGGRTFADTAAYRDVLQPWEQWTLSGLLDVAMPMLYFREDRHASYHRNWLAYASALAAAGDVLVAPGQGSWLNTVEQSTVQLSTAEPVTDGTVLFSYQLNAAEGPPDALLSALGSSLWAPP